MTENNINEIISDLNEGIKSKNYKKIENILDSLNDIKMNVDLLKSTQIGKIVNKLKKNTGHTNIIKKSKELVLKWKKEINYSPKKNIIKKNYEINNHNNNNNNNNKNNSNSDDNTIDWKTGNETKDKMRKKFISLLKPNNNNDNNYEYINIACDIETELSKYYENKPNNKDMLTKYRDLAFNIKKNEELKEDILNGVYAPSKLVTLSNEELAKKSLQKKRKETVDQQIKELQGKNAGMETSNTKEYKCGKCKQRNCRYSQAQTRSADEPMTIFVSCLTCGNKYVIQIKYYSFIISSIIDGNVRNGVRQRNKKRKEKKRKKQIKNDTSFLFFFFSYPIHTKYFNYFTRLYYFKINSFNENIF